MKKWLIGLLTLLSVTACSDLGPLLGGEAPQYVVNSENSLNHGILFNDQVSDSEFASWQNSGAWLSSEQYPMSFELDFQRINDDLNFDYSGYASLEYYVGSGASESGALKIYTRSFQEDWKLVGTTSETEPGWQFLELESIDRHVKVVFENENSFFNVSEIEFFLAVDSCPPDEEDCEGGGKRVRLLP